MTDGANVRIEGGVHVTLMGAGSVATTLRHYCPFVDSERRSHHSIFNMVRVNACLKKRVSHIELPPNLTPCTVREDLLDAREWVYVGHCISVESSGAEYRYQTSTPL